MVVRLRSCFLVSYQEEAILNSYIRLCSLACDPLQFSKLVTSPPYAPILLTSLSATSLTKLFGFNGYIWLDWLHPENPLLPRKIMGVVPRDRDHGDQNPACFILHSLSLNPHVALLHFITSLDLIVHHFNHVLLLFFILSPLCSPYPSG